MLIPPYPPRPADPPSFLNFCKIADDNLLAIWSQGAFVLKQFQLRFLWQRLTVANRPQLVKQVLLDNARNYQKGYEIRRALTPLLGQGLIINEGESWNRQRRLLTPLFKQASLHRFSELVLSHAQSMLERWDNEYRDKELDLSYEMTRITMKIIAEALFAYPLSETQVAAAFNAMSRYQDSYGRFDIIGLLNLPNWIPSWHGYRGRSAITQLNHLFHEISRHAQPMENNAPQLFDLMDRTHPQTRDELATLFIAGHETTANTLAWAGYLLSQHPQVEARLYDEIQQVLATRPPGLDDLPELRYTRAVLEETLRLYPPVYMLSRQAMADDRLDNIKVPAGSAVFVSPWLLHRHKAYWKDPDAFIPERFLNETSGQRAKYCYIPFSAGPRRCPGSQLAMTEAVLILAMIVQRYQLRLRAGHPVEALGRLTIRPRYGLPMQLITRN